MIELGKNSLNLAPSPTVQAIDKVAKLSEQKIEVIRLDIGEPDFETPDHVRQAAIDAIRAGFTHYTSPRGLKELRQALAVSYSDRRVVTKDDNVIVFPGSKTALFAVLSLILGSNDQLIIQNPVWPSYRLISEYVLAGVIQVDANEETGFVPSVSSFEKSISKRTKAIMINNPCNPTGSVIPKKTIEELLALCNRKNIVLILDEIYAPLFYGKIGDTIPRGDLENDNLIVIGGFSKHYAMTGWRLGHVIASKTFIDWLVRFQENTTTCPSSFAQKAAIAALNGPKEWFDEMMKTYSQRRRVMLESIESIPGWECYPPEGAFYCFPKINTKNSIDFADKLLSSEHVSVLAGAYFGSMGEEHLRLSFTTSEKNIIQGMNKIREFSEKYS